MTTYGMTPTGFLPKPATVCRTELASSLLAKRGSSVDVSDSSLEGQFIAILSEREGSIWDALQALYAAADPDMATDASQDAVCAITGTFRQSSASSLVIATLTGNPTTVVSAGTQGKTASTSALFTSLASATIASVTAWAGSTVYTLGARRTNNGNVYQCTVPGTSAASVGPVGTPAAGTYFFVDGTATWCYLGVGTGAIDTVMISVVQDAIIAAALDLNLIATPVGGLLGIINVNAATLGNPQQTNESLRVTREGEIAAAGTGIADAIRAALLQVSGVSGVTVFHNDTDSIDANGQKPHSVQALVIGGADADIAQVLFSQVSAGIQTDSTAATVTVVIPDSMGINQTIKFTRVTATPVYVDVTYTYNPAASTKGGYPLNGDALAQTAIAVFGNTVQTPGKDVVASSIGAALFPIFINGAQVAGVQGILDVTSTKISTAPSPTVSTTIVIDPFHQATIIVANVTIHSSPGSV